MTCRDERFAEEPQLFTVTDEDGQERSFLPDATLEWQGKRYTVLYPCDPKTQEVTDKTLFYVLDEDDTLAEIDPEALLAQLDQLLDPEE